MNMQEMTKYSNAKSRCGQGLGCNVYGCHVKERVVRTEAKRRFFSPPSLLATPQLNRQAVCEWWTDKDIEKGAVSTVSSDTAYSQVLDFL